MIRVKNNLQTNKQNNVVTINRKIMITKINKPSSLKDSLANSPLWRQ